MNQMALTIDSYLALLVVLINLIFAILVLVRTSRAAFYLIFFFTSLSNMLWNFGDGLYYLTGKGFWFYLSLTGSAMLPALMFHFINILVRPERKWNAWILMAYIISGFLTFSSVLALFYPGTKQFVDSIYWNILYLVLLGPFILAGIILLISHLKKTISEEERSRLGYILIATIIAVLTGLTDLVQLLKFPIPPLGHFGCLLYSSILAIGVFKHRRTYDSVAQMRMKLDALSEMAAEIAHEIRNPLTSIKGASNLLGNELKKLNQPKIHEYHALITEEIERLNNILVNFRDLTQPLKMEKELISIDEVLQKTVKLVEMDTSNLEIRLEASGKLPKIQGDASFLKQVFLNLIKNSMEACGAGGELLIKTASDPAWVKVSFSDDGPGIPVEIINRIFEPFFTTKSRGMGVGLAICQRIIQAHSGRIEVNNTLPKGTQFNIFLPKAS